MMRDIFWIAKTPVRSRSKKKKVFIRAAQSLLVSRSCFFTSHFRAVATKERSLVRFRAFSEER